jgi:hypothetical protein
MILGFISMYGGVQTQLVPSDGGGDIKKTMKGEGGIEETPRTA